MPSYYAEQILNMKKDKMKTSLAEKDKTTIINHFKHLVCAVKKDAVVIKHSKYGYEIFKSAVDNKYWTYAVTFTEPINAAKPVYKHHWVGNAFVGYGFETLAEVLEKTAELMQRGPTANVHFRDYLSSWDEQEDRIYLDWEEKEFTYEEYNKFQKWFAKNKIKIMAKQVGVKDAEDYNKEKEQQKTGLAVLLGKMQDPPRRPRAMAVMIRPTAKNKTEWHDPKLKKYIIGFMYVE
ncbi:hypothetical protein SSYRP_v1c03300 [Spiroplasma syrphidicola EA-1]|uniref:Uncharacterized protein n=1 Tax=Spiroplasma syrphidicola EA-1 TaxID=1276229 RepID=R4UDD3_9MOLU|nr:hypothetical protein [Spiroplasma syrphidicola]AGM25924.1 hypothetical protein SSYRP_v1c03300 [Spiroplasma syrphidicola EA-1]